jgi:hypothetical protein
MKKRRTSRCNLLKLLLYIAMTNMVSFNEAHPIYLGSIPSQQPNYRAITSEAERKPPSSLFLDIGHLSSFGKVQSAQDIGERIQRCEPAYSEYWDEGLDVDAIALSSACIDKFIIHQLEDRRRDDGAEELPLEKRGGGGMSRHLFAASTAATLALGTASLGIFYNSLKAYDQDKYGVSKKTGLNDKSKDGKKSKDSKSEGDKGKSDEKGKDDGRKSKSKDDDEPGSPASPTFINHITYVNNINIDPSKFGKTRRDVDDCRDTGPDGDGSMVSGHRIISENGPQLHVPEQILNKRTKPVIAPAAAPAKGWHKYDKHAPFLEVGLSKSQW